MFGIDGPRDPVADDPAAASGGGGRSSVNAYGANRYFD